MSLQFWVTGIILCIVGSDESLYYLKFGLAAVLVFVGNQDGDYRFLQDTDRLSLGVVATILVIAVGHPCCGNAGEQSSRKKIFVITI